MSMIRRRGAASPDPDAVGAAQTRSDDALLAAIAAGDPAAFAEVYAAHAGRVHALARSLCGQARAEELTQEIFLRLWTDPQRFDPERGTLRSFLTMQAHSRAVDVLRTDTARRARELAESTLPKQPQRDAAAAALDAVERADVGELVSLLPERERQPIVLAYFGGHTYPEVARLLDIPEGTIKSRIRSGMQRLRAELSNELNLA